MSVSCERGSNLVSTCQPTVLHLLLGFETKKSSFDNKHGEIISFFTYMEALLSASSCGYLNTCDFTSVTYQLVIRTDLKKKIIWSFISLWVLRRCRSPCSPDIASGHWTPSLTFFVVIMHIVA